MIRRIQALNYRCLRHVDVTLDRFHVMVGPNASGKSTLFDAVAFLGDLVADGLDAALDRRTRNFQDLVWGRPKEGLGFELAVEFGIPERLLAQLPQERNYRVFRYEVAVRETDGDIRIDSERGLLIPAPSAQPSVQRELFPKPPPPTDSILVGGNRRGSRTIFSKSPQAQDNFNVETSSRSGKGWATSIAFGHRRSTLGNLPESPKNFPVSMYVKQVLGSSIKSFFLDSMSMREASAPAKRGHGIAQDGSNLPWMIKRLEAEHPQSYREWLSHVRTTLSELEYVGVVEREDDRHAYQVLIATYSPVVLRMTPLEDALCFAKDSEGATDIVRGDDHPRLRDWQGSPNMEVLFATGVIG